MGQSATGLRPTPCLRFRNMETPAAPSAPSVGDMQTPAAHTAPSLGDMGTAAAEPATERATPTAADIDVTPLPTRVRGEAQRILDGAARRLLSEKADADTLGTAAGRDGGTLDGRTDERALLV